MRQSARPTVCIFACVFVASLGAGCGDDEGSATDVGTDTRQEDAAEADTSDTDPDTAIADSGDTDATEGDIDGTDGSELDTSPADATEGDATDTGEQDTTPADTTATDADDVDATSQDTTPTDADSDTTDVAPMDTDDADDGGDTGLPPGPSSDRHTAHALGTRYESLGFWEYLPVAYGSGEEFPLMIFFHGLGENGDGSLGALDNLLGVGPPRHIERDEWPLDASSAGDEFIVLAPQTQNDCPSPGAVNDFLRWAAAEYDVDITRIYLTGISCGGIGVWNYVRQYLVDDLVAAIVPIAGDGRGAWNTHECALGAIPIWAFHGDPDGRVSTEGTNVPIDNLAGCTDPAPVDASKVLYPGIGHSGWRQTYDLSAGHDIYSWMLSHTNPDASLE